MSPELASTKWWVVIRWYIPLNIHRWHQTAETQAPAHYGARLTPPANERKKHQSRAVKPGSASIIHVLRQADKRGRSLCSRLVGRGHPVRVLGGRLGVAQDGLARVAVVRLVQGDVLDDEGRQGAAVGRHSSSATCGRDAGEGRGATATTTTTTGVQRQSG